METALQVTALYKTEDRKQRKAAEDEEVKMIDLEEYDPLGESKRLRLSAALLRWQRSPPHRFSRRTLLLGGVAAVGLGGVAMAWRGCAQQTLNTSFAPPRSSRPDALVSKGQTLYTYRGHAAAVFSVGWSPDGTSIASASTDTTVQVWHAASGRHNVTYRGHASPVLTTAWSPDGKRIVSGGGDTGGEAGGDTSVQVWDALDDGHVLTYRGHSQPVLSVAWSPDGASIASGSTDTTVQVWRAL